MKEKLLMFLLPNILDALISQFSIETVKQWLDNAFDFIEDKIQESPTKIDDSFLPLMYAIRTLLNVPDNDSAASTKKA